MKLQNLSKEYRVRVFGFLGDDIIEKLPEELRTQIKKLKKGVDVREDENPKPVDVGFEGLFRDLEVEEEEKEPENSWEKKDGQNPSKSEDKESK